MGFLDTDLGQPEFTAPGVVSLHLLRGPVLGESGEEEAMCVLHDWGEEGALCVSIDWGGGGQYVFQVSGGQKVKCVSEVSQGEKRLCVSRVSVERRGTSPSTASKPLLPRLGRLMLCLCGCLQCTVVWLLAMHCWVAACNA